MPLFTEQEVRRLSPLLRDLEREEPVVCAWRYQGGGGSVPPSWPRLRRLGRIGRDAVLRVKRLPRPAVGQVVVLSHATTPATMGTLRPVMMELAGRGRPAFLITTPRTRALLSEGLHRGHADILQIAAAVGLSARRGLRRRVQELAGQLKSILGADRDGQAELWLELGMAVSEGARQWSGGAGVVITDADLEASRKGFVVGASRAGVPSVVLQHGLLGSHQFPVHADRLFCWGAYFRRQAESYGLEAARAVVVGSPRWDALHALRSAPRNPAVRQKLGGSPGKPLVLVISNAHGAPLYPGLYHPHFEGIQRLVEAGLDVVVKLHPAENGLSGYAGVMPEPILNAIHVVPPDLSLHDALRHSDVVYHVFSAAALEAMLLGVPVLFERGTDDAPRLCDFPDLGGGEWSTSSSVVERCRILSAPGSERTDLLADQEAFLEQALANRGRALAAVVDLLES
jgi:hypothetical protein